MEEPVSAQDRVESREHRDPRAHPHGDDWPIADVLDQETPVGEIDDEPLALDDDRVEPIGPADWYDAGPADPESADE
jgi:hypothetical protein